MIGITSCVHIKFSTGQVHTSVAGSWLWLLLIGSHAKRGCPWLPKGIGSLPGGLGTKGGDSGGLGKRRLSWHAPKGRLCLRRAVLFLSSPKHTCKDRRTFMHSARRCLTIQLATDSVPRHPHCLTSMLLAWFL